jgi:hypothetical protein
MVCLLIDTTDKLRGPPADCVQAGDQVNAPKRVQALF